MDASIIQMVFAIINISSLILLGTGYFKSRFTIVDLETYNTMMEVIEEYTQMKENENSGGGSGFFWDYISDIEEDNQEEEEENNKRGI